MMLYRKDLGMRGIILRDQTGKMLILGKKQLSKFNTAEIERK